MLHDVFYHVKEHVVVQHSVITPQHGGSLLNGYINYRLDNFVTVLGVISNYT